MAKTAGWQSAFENILEKTKPTEFFRGFLVAPD
jgi:hypothetical protein